MISKPPAKRKNSDMADRKGLVDYSSDSDEGHEAISTPSMSAAPPTLGKRKRPDHQTDLPVEQPERSQALPPLPSRFHDLYVSASRTSTSDDPSLHGGRMRVIPHVDGNWATHIYLECMSPHNVSTQHRSVSIALLPSCFQPRLRLGSIDSRHRLRADLNRRAPQTNRA